MDNEVNYTMGPMPCPLNYHQCFPSCPSENGWTFRYINTFRVAHTLRHVRRLKIHYYKIALSHWLALFATSNCILVVISTLGLSLSNNLNQWITTLSLAVLYRDGSTSINTWLMKSMSVRVWDSNVPTFGTHICKKHQCELFKSMRWRLNKFLPSIRWKRKKLFLSYLCLKTKLSTTGM